MFMPKLAILTSSSKPDERRIPILPQHLPQIDRHIRGSFGFEKNYSKHFYYYDDDFYQRLGCQVQSREQLLENSESFLILRPEPKDLLAMRPHAKVIGWFHCVQNQAMSQAAIQRKLTLIDIEKIKINNSALFSANSYTTGKEAVLYPLTLLDIHPTVKTRIVILGYSAVSVGAIRQLQRLGFKKITCCTRRDPQSINDKIADVDYRQIRCINGSSFVETVAGQPILQLLKEADIIINAIGQNIRKPMLFLQESQIGSLKKDVLIIDASCDKPALGFDFPIHTSIKKPITRIQNAWCCAIDHFPTVDYMNASQYISQQFIKLLPIWLEALGRNAFSSPFAEAITVRDGNIIDEDIHYFKQHYAPILDNNFA